MNKSRFYFKLKLLKNETFIDNKNIGTIYIPIFMTDPSVEVSSVSQSCPTLRPHGLQHTRPPVHHQLPEFIQNHVD